MEWGAGPVIFSLLADRHDFTAPDQQRMATATVQSTVEIELPSGTIIHIQANAGERRAQTR
jgi:hypothetical protein